MLILIDQQKLSQELKILEYDKNLESPLLKSAQMVENKFLDVFLEHLPQPTYTWLLNIPELQELFKFMGFKMPAESTARVYLLT